MVKERICIPGAVRQLRKALADGALDIVEDALLDRQEGIAPVFVDDLAQPFTGHVLGRDLGAQVQRVHFRRAGVAQEGHFNVVADLALVHDLHRRSQRHFLIGVARADAPASGARAAHVDLVHDDTGPRDPLAVVEDRHHDGGIHRVQRAIPGIAGHEGIAVMDVVAEHLDDVLDDDVEGGGLTDDEDAGVQALAVGGQDRDVEVTGLVHGWCAGNPADHQCHFVVQFPQAVAQDLERDDIDLGQGISHGVSLP